MEKTVEVTGLSKKFQDFYAVKEINFSVTKGEIFGFLGPNGAGKSTTIRMLCGILKPTSGSGSVAGHDIMNKQNKIKNVIGYMSQKFSLYGDLTVNENLELFGSIYGLSGKSLKKRMNYVMEIADIGSRRNMITRNLPGGMKQRLALGAALLHDPEILFLDEPTSGVDPFMRRTFWEFIYKLSQEGKTIFVTTHYMDEAEHCDRMALIISGEIIALDSPSALKINLAYDIYSISVPNFINIFEYVSDFEFVHDAAIFGSNIHVLFKKGHSSKKELIKTLNKKGIKNITIEQVQPSLEDVFVVHAREHGL